MVDVVKMFLSSSLINPQHLVTVSHTVYAHRGSTLLGRGMGDPLERCPSPPYYHTKFGHSRSNHMSVSMGSKKFWEAGAACLKKETHSSPYYHAEIGRCKSIRMSGGRALPEYFKDAGALPL